MTLGSNASLRAFKKISAGIVIFAFTLTGVLENAVGIDLKKAFALPGSFLPIAAALGDLQTQANISKSFHTDLYTGSMVYQVPIVVPNGRKGMTPEVSLSYSSSSGSSWAGIGWNLDHGFIQRSTKRGVPTYNDNSDTFELLVRGVHAELVKLSTSEYHVKYETGEFMKIIRQGDYWVLTDKSGTQYTFGQNEQAKDRNTKGIFGWYLEKVKDTSGNIIQYTYVKDQGEIYPSRIDYNGNESQSFSPTHSIEFILENRPDVTFSFITGVKVISAKRLKEILVKVQGQLARKYVLAYEQSPAVGKSRLKTVKECGTDSIPGQDNTGTCLPPTTFTYQEQTFGFQPGEVWTFPNTSFRPISTGLDTETVSTIDMDGDGYPDRVFKTSDTLWTIYKNLGFTGNGFSSYGESWSPIQGSQSSSWSSIRGDSNGTSNYTNLIDINRDGRLDRVIRGYSGNAGGSSGWAVQYNNGHGFDPQIYFGPAQETTEIRTGQWYHPDGFDPDTYRVLWDAVDMNSDGYVDRLKTIDNNTWGIYWGTPAGFSSTLYNWTNVQGTQNWNSVRDYDSDTGVGYGDLMDLNGDDLPDRIIGGTAGNFQVQYNNGLNFENIQLLGTLPAGTTAGITMDTDGSSHNHPNTTHALIDVNQDGLPDRVQKISNTQWEVHFNTGSSFVTVGVPWGPIEGYSDADKAIRRTDGDNVVVDYFDINGDGFPDRIVSHGSEAKWLVQLAYSTVPDLLSEVNNGAGGITSVTYKPSTKYYNGGPDGYPDLAFPVITVSSITSQDGLGNSIVTQYDYADGKYDTANREFRGFNRARVIDGNGDYTDTWFKQDDAFKGRVYLTESRDAQQTMYAQVWNTWQTSQPANMPGVTFGYLFSTTHYIYDGTTSPKFTQTDFFYDAYGNINETLNWGEVLPDQWNNFSGDEVRSKIQYAYNENLWIMDKPYHTETYDDQWNRIQESWFYYDNNTNFTTAPTKGLITKQEDLVSITPYSKVQMEMTYDGFGNLLTVKDARGYITTNQYDTDLKLFLVKVTNPLSQSQEFVYDPLFNQIKQAKDQNGQLTRTVYDTLGRAIKTYSPLDSEASPTQGIYYDDIMLPLRVVTYTKVDYNAPSLNLDGNPHTGYLTTYAFFDGLGREIQKRSPAENSNQQIVTGFVKFDAEGQVSKQYTPYIADFRTTYASPPDNFPHAEFQYDAVGRLTTTLYPDGTTSRTEYDRFTRTLIDQNNHEKRYTQDAYGNIVQVEEFNGTETYTTQYQYDRFARLIQTIDHSGNATQVDYDLLGRKTHMIDPGMGEWSYTYDSNNNLLSQTDAKSQTITFQYDELNRPKKKLYPNGTHIDYTYDQCPSDTCGGLSGENYPIGKLLKVEDQSGILLLRYDKSGRVVQDEKHLDNGQAYSFTRIYDPQGRVKDLQYPDQDILHLDYNLMGEAETLTLIRPDQTQATIISNVDYNAAGQLVKIQYGNGVTTDYSYNAQNLRLEHLLTRNAQAQTLQDFGYQFDFAGNIKDITDTVNTNTQHFEYDDLYRLKQAQGSYGTHNYQYNAIGNMLQKNTATLQYQDPLHPHAVTRYINGSENISYQYDLTGNMTKRTFSSSLHENLIYDYENRLVKIDRVTTSGGCQLVPYYDVAIATETAGDGIGLRSGGGSGTADGTNSTSQGGAGQYQQTIVQRCPSPPTVTTQTIAQYIYDASGQRVKKVAGNKTQYYLGKDYELEYNGSNLLTRKAFFLGDTRVAEFEIPSSVGSVPHLRFFHQDHLGSTNIITNEQGQQNLLMEYLPYGEVKRIQGNDPVQNTYTGQKSDAESNLMYYNARYYDPKIGRFISADPTIQRPYDPQDLNRYAYVRNNPINFTDPTGLGWFKKLWKKITKPFVKQLKWQAKLLGKIPFIGEKIAQSLRHDFIAPLEDPGKWWKDHEAKFKSALKAGGSAALFTAIVAVVLAIPTGGASLVALPAAAATAFASAAAADLTLSTPGGQQVLAVTSKGLQVLGMSENTANLIADFGIRTVLTGAYAKGFGETIGRDILRRTEQFATRFRSPPSPGRIVIGEGMQRVRSAAIELGAETFETNSPPSQLMSENRSWLFDKIRQGYEVFDIGPQAGRTTPSAFYKMEKTALRRTHYPVKQYSFD